MQKAWLPFALTKKTLHTNVFTGAATSIALLYILVQFSIAEKFNI